MKNAISRRSVLSLLLAAPTLSFASQESKRKSGGVSFQARPTEKWRFGLVVTATGNTTGITATLPIPMEWPEQKIISQSEDISRQVKKPLFRTLEGGVKQMVISIPRLAAGDEASAVITQEIEKSWIEAPEDVARFHVPAKTPKEFAKYLGASPYIETGDAAIRKAAASSIDGENDWQRVLSMFNWVRENVKYKFAEKIKPAFAALKEGEGDCEELSSLFIAFCRLNKIPARAVWVPGHTYPEFYLEDDSGQGHWFPCQAAGAAPDIGLMPEDRPILQKGDNFKVPEQKGPQRYVMNHLSAKDATAAPQVKFILEKVKEESK